MKCLCCVEIIVMLEYSSPVKTLDRSFIQYYISLHLPPTSLFSIFRSSDKLVSYLFRIFFPKETYFRHKPDTNMESIYCNLRVISFIIITDAITRVITGKLAFSSLRLLYFVYFSAGRYSLVQSRALSLVAGEPWEDVAVIPGPQRRGGGRSVAISRPEAGRRVREV